jgi:hypothetical protein
MNKNMTCFCLVSVALLVIVGVAVGNPMVATQFDSYVQMQVTGNGQSVSYSGSMYYDLPTLRKREVLQVNGQNLDVLSRYDLVRFVFLRCSIISLCVFYTGGSSRGF